MSEPPCVTDWLCLPGSHLRFGECVEHISPENDEPCMCGTPFTCMADDHTEHKYDCALNRWVGFDPRVNEWGPCKAPALVQHTRRK